MRVKIKFFLVALIVCSLAFGCSGSSDDPVVEKAKEKPKAAAEKVASTVDKGIKKALDEASSISVTKTKEILEKQGSKFSYDPVNKPDPFRAYKLEEMPGGDILAGENPLLKYEIRYFRLVGISAEDADNMALFEDPNGRAYILHVGDRIGRGGGVVQSITPDTVVVTETRISTKFEDVGGTETVQIPIKLHPDETNG